MVSSCIHSVAQGSSSVAISLATVESTGLIVWSCRARSSSGFGVVMLISTV